MNGRVHKSERKSIAESGSSTQTGGSKANKTKNRRVKHSWKSMLRLLTFAKLQIDHIELQISIQI